MTYIKKINTTLLPIFKNQISQMEQNSVLHPRALKNIQNSIYISSNLTPYGVFEFKCREEEGLLGLFIDEQPVGFCSYRHRYGTSDLETGFQELEIYDLWIQPAYRKNGHATLFQTWFKDLVHRIGMECCIPAERTFLFSDPISEKGLRWYEGLCSKVYTDYPGRLSSVEESVTTLVSSASP